MPVQVTYPGVYVQEAPSGVHAISGVATSVAAFVGMCPSGPVNLPTRIFSFREFAALFGGSALVGEMTDQVRQFFMNGGGTAWIVRNAAGALDGDSLKARSTLQAEDNTDVLTLSARSAGSTGNELRVEIDYATSSPERSFNLKTFRQTVQSDGQVKRSEEETLTDLSMDPASPRHVAKIVNEQSGLLTAAIPAGLAVSGANVSQSGLIFDATAPGGIKQFFGAHLAGPTHKIILSVANGAPVQVSLAGLSPLADSATICAAIRAAAVAELPAGTNLTVERRAAAGGEVLQFSSTQGPVVVTSAPSNDAAAILRLGIANGGLETDHWSSRRPAANGLVTRMHTGSSVATAFRRIHILADTAGNTLGDWALTAATTSASATPGAPFNAAPKLGVDATGLTGVIGSFAAVAGALDVLVTSIDANSGGDFEPFRAGLRLGVRPTYGTQDSDLSLSLTSTGAYALQTGDGLAQASLDPTNVVRYALGSAVPVPPAGPGGTYRTFGQAGNDGAAPLPVDYDYSFDKLERTADIFNLVILPRAVAQLDSARAAVWGPASAFCKKKRAFLLVDPPTDGSTANPWTSANAASADAVAFRSGVVTDYAAVYWPRIVTADGRGQKITIDPAGTMAGVYAKTDVKRGIWKAPAGLEASLIGVRGLETLITNDENGLTNPQAINTLRTMASGATSWGARTMIGYEGAPDQDYRYVPVRRLALYIEESLYRGLQFAVFEPNGETLWGQIRLTAGSFMNGLFRQGAFKGLKASDAYYVACDRNTTTPTDINLGIVNVEVGFAPLKPAEFVVLTIKQMVGQIEV